MIIGFDGSRAFVKDKTGTENYSYQLLKALSRIDQQNKYVVFLRTGTAVDRFPDNFHFQIIDWPKFWTQAGLAWETFKVKLDVLFVPSHTLPILRKPGLKTIVTVHDLGSEYLPQMHQVKQRLYLSFMQKFQLKGATKVIAVSKATKEDLINRIGIEPEKIVVVYEGYDKNLFKVDTKVNTLRYFLCVGTVQPRKNLARVIRAFAQILGTKLVIAGQKGWLSDEIYRLPKKLKIEERVKFLGYVSEKDLPALYSQAIALVYPSLYEGFGLPILEAQACGCPVITSNLSSMPEIAGKGALYVNPYDVKAITRAMMKMQTVAIKRQLIINGFDNVKRFSWEKCARETLAVLESV